VAFTARSIGRPNGLGPSQEESTMKHVMYGTLSALALLLAVHD